MKDLLLSTLVPTFTLYVAGIALASHGINKGLITFISPVKLVCLSVGYG